MDQSTAAAPRRRLYYGWVVVGVAFVTLALAVNARTAFSLLFPPILDDFGWDRGTTAAAFSIGFIASTGFAPFIGMLMDRYGPRFVIPLASVIVATGFATATVISTPLGLYLTLGLLATGGAIALSYVGHSMFLPLWFVRRRGLAVGIAFSGVGIGAVVILPAIQVLIEQQGWRTTCLILAVVIVAVLVPLNTLFQRRHPADLGLNPDGVENAPSGQPQRNYDALILDKDWAATDWTLKKAIRTARFWWIFAGYFCGLYAWYAIQVHQTKFLIELGFDTKEAAFALGLVALAGVPGQIAIGALSDRFGREIAWTVSLLGFTACYALLLGLAARPSPVLLYAMVTMQGLLGYGVAALYGIIPSDIFTGPRFATIFSVATLGGNIGAGTGSWITGLIHDWQGSYVSGFWLAIILSLISIFCIWQASPRKIRRVPGSRA